MKNKKYSWNLEDLYKSDDDPKMEKDLEKAVEKNYEFIDKWKNRSDYLENPKVLREALDEDNLLSENYGLSMGVGYYLGLRNSQDETNKEIIKRVKKLNQTTLKTLNDQEFFYLNISKIPKSKQTTFLNSKSLLPYKHLLEKLFKVSKHLLSEKEEKILNLTSSTSYGNWVSMTSQFLSKEMLNVLNEDGDIIEIPLAMVKKYLQSKKQKVRDIASKENLRALEKWSDVAEHEMNSILENKRVFDEIKGYSRPDENKHVNGDISTKVVDTMLSSVVEDFELPKKYYKLKAQLVGKEKLSYFERYLPYGEIQEKYSYEKAIEIVKKVLNNLDPKFGEIIEDLYEKGRYDVFPARGKHNGAYCTHNSKKLPIYILLNHKDNLDSVSTIAHETGHAINNYMMFEKQLSLNCDTPLSIAEVSSTFFEDFVSESILSNADDETRLSMLINKLDSDIGAIYRQVACYKFEQELHKKFRAEGFLSKEKVSEMFKKYMVSYMGKYVSQDKGSEYFWVTWSHIRRFFYVYSYANGLLISKALQRMVREDPKNIEKVKRMLSTGASQSPEEMFKEIGIDISKKEFWDKGLQEVEDTYNEAYSLAKKLGKI